MYVQHQYVHAITQAIIYLPNLTRDGKRKRFAHAKSIGAGCKI